MAALEYFLDDIEITGTIDNPQTLTYGALTDVDGAVLPSYFNTGMVIIPGAPDQDVDIIITEKGNATFSVAMRGAGVQQESVMCSFFIAGEYDPFYIVVLRD